MKLISKTYLLVAILIGAAAINLYLFYEDSNSQTTQSYSIITVANVKVLGESISASATGAANDNQQAKENLQKEISEVNDILKIIRNGGAINGQTLDRLPESLISDHNNLQDTWKMYYESAQTVGKTSVFDPDASNAQDYILQKNPELSLLVLQMNDEFDGLPRDFNRHKQIAQDLAECVQVIGEQAFLLSSGNDNTVQNSIQEKRLQFDIGIRKLLQISTADLDVESVGMEHENLIEIPRENSEALRQMDPLWESMLPKLYIIEERGLFSTEYDIAKSNMDNNKNAFYTDLDNLIQDWTAEISNQGSEEQSIIQIILVIDIAVFFLVLFVIRKSLSPLESITQALSKVKEGKYGEKINYEGTDEVGQLVSNFNIMSNTIKEKEEEAKKTDIAKDEFLAMITHELKTPLVPIQGYSDILLSEHLGKLTDQQKERINIIKSSSEALLSIISDLLDAQKLELGQLRMKKENANIKDTINKAIETMLPEAAQHGVTIDSHVTEIQIEHDPERIRQVITNLIKNSITAVPENTGKIDVDMAELEDKIIINVRDNGMGIPEEKQTDLFKKFYQVDATLTRERGGSGLGLAICKGIIDNHYGEISVSSVVNQGSTFSFTIPKNQTNSINPIGTT